MAGYFWVGGSGNWTANDTTNWALTSGGAGGAGFPTSLDDVTFDNNSGTGTVSLYSSPTCKSWNFTATTANLKFDNAGTTILFVYGNIATTTNTQLGGTLTTLFISMSGVATGRTSAIPTTTLVSQMTYTDGGTISQSAATFTYYLTISGAAVTFTGAISVPNFVVTSGSLTSGAFTHTIGDAGTSTPYLQFFTGSTLTLTGSTFNVGTAYTGAGSTFPLVNFQTGITVTAANTIFNLGKNSVGASNYCTFAGGYTFGAVNMFYSAGSYLQGSSTFNSALTITNAYSTGLYVDGNNTVAGTFTLTGASISNRLNVFSDAPGTQRTFTLTSASAGVKTITNVNFADIQITNSGGTITATSVGDCLGNTMPAGVLTTAVTRYAIAKLAGVTITGTAGQFSCTATTGITTFSQVKIIGTFGGTGSISGYVSGTIYYVIATNGTSTFTLSADGVNPITTTAGTPTGLTYGITRTYTSTLMWSATSGGATGATAPLPQDTVIFDANTGPGNVVADANNAILGKDVNLTGFTGSLDSSYILMVVYGALTNPVPIIATTVVYATRTNTTISAIPNSSAFPLTVAFSNPGATITLGAALTPGSSSQLSLNFAAGTFTTNNYNITASNVVTGGTTNYYGGCVGNNGTNTLNLGSSVISLSNSGAPWNAASTTTISPGTSKISLTAATSLMYFVANNSGSYYDLEFACASSISVNRVQLQYTAKTFNSFSNTTTTPLLIELPASTTTTVTTLALAGSKGGTVALSTTSASSSGATSTVQSTLALASSVTSSYVVYRGIIKSGAGILNARGVANLGNNSGISFTSIVKALAFTGTTAAASSGSFTVPTDFTGSSLLVAIGGGGGGARRGTVGSAGGGAGAMQLVSNPNITTGQTVYYTAGRGGPGGIGATVLSGTSGTQSWINVTANSVPTVVADGTVANFGTGASSSNSSSTAGGATTSPYFFAYAGNVGGGSPSISYTSGAGGGGAPSLTYQGGGGGGQATTTASAGGSGGGGVNGTASSSTTQVGGAGGANLSAGTAAGGAANTVGATGTLGGGGGGGGGALTTTTGGAGGGASSNNEFNYTSLNGVASLGSIGPSGGGGGGGASATGTGGAGGSATYGGGGGGGGKGGTTATGGNGGNGGPGLVLFVYEAASSGGARGFFIG